MRSPLWSCPSRSFTTVSLVTKWNCLEGSGGPVVTSIDNWSLATPSTRAYCKVVSAAAWSAGLSADARPCATAANVDSAAETRKTARKTILLTELISCLLEAQPGMNFTSRHRNRDLKGAFWRGILDKHYFNV